MPEVTATDQVQVWSIWAAGKWCLQQRQAWSHLWLLVFITALRDLSVTHVPVFVYFPFILLVTAWSSWPMVQAYIEHWIIWQQKPLCLPQHTFCTYLMSPACFIWQVFIDTVYKIPLLTLRSIHLWGNKECAPRSASTDGKNADEATAPSGARFMILYQKKVSAWCLEKRFFAFLQMWRFVKHISFEIPFQDQCLLFNFKEWTGPNRFRFQARSNFCTNTLLIRHNEDH